METTTAASAWRAISPVSMVTECGPYWKVLRVAVTLETSFLKPKANGPRY
jgi:hypothetical protein